MLCIVGSFSPVWPISPNPVRFSSTSSPVLFLTLDSAFSVLPSPLGRGSLPAPSWAHPVCHLASPMRYYCLPLSSRESLGSCYTASAPFSLPRPSCLCSALTLLWSFAFRFPRALVLAPPGLSVTSVHSDHFWSLSRFPSVSALCLPLCGGQIHCPSNDQAEVHEEVQSVVVE